MDEKNLNVSLTKKRNSLKNNYDVSALETHTLEPGYLSDVLKDKWRLWKKYRAIILYVQTGRGKNTFVEDVLVEEAIRGNFKIVIVSNRIALDISIKRRIAKKLNIYKGYNDAALHDISDYGNIQIYSCQQLKNVIKDNNDLRDIKYAIFDEAHYFTSDASFSKDNGELLQSIPKVFSEAVRIYMSATIEQVLPYIFNAECSPMANHRWKNRHTMDSYYQKIQNNCIELSDEERNCLVYESDFAHFGPTPIVYKMNHDYSHMELRFYTEDSEIENLLSSTKGKSIMFVTTKERGKELSQMFKDSQYIDSETKDKEPEVMNKLINEEKFDKKILITTSVFENGCNIKDIRVKNVIIELVNPSSILQMAGRKRRCSNTDSFTLYLKAPSIEDLNKLKGQTKQILKLIQLSEEHPSQFMLEILNENYFTDQIKNLVSVRDVRYKFDWLTKEVLQESIDYYDELVELIESDGTEGYCQKIAEELFNKEFTTDMILSSKETATQELICWINSYTNKKLNEETLKKFCSDFKTKYTAIRGNLKRDNRAKERQNGGHTWLRNRLKELELPFMITCAGDKTYILLPEGQLDKE